jgi:hypothetical protein
MQKWGSGMAAARKWVGKSKERVEPANFIANHFPHLVFMADLR